MKRRNVEFLIYLCLIFFCSLTIDVHAEDPLPKNDKQEQSDPSNCLNCHKEPKIAAIFSTPHAQKGDFRTPFANLGCDTCHGVKDHPKTTFGAKAATPADEQNQVCLGCHERDNRTHWQGSAHQSSDLSCASCHTVHATQDPILDKPSQTKVCFTCHGEQKAQSFLRSRHPIRVSQNGLQRLPQSAWFNQRIPFD
ncbi:MAG: cytochrome c3 family protein [Gammaproteobacteria bacterium]